MNQSLLQFIDTSLGESLAERERRKGEREGEWKMTGRKGRKGEKREEGGGGVGGGKEVRQATTLEGSTRPVQP